MKNAPFFVLLILLSSMLSSGIGVSNAEPIELKNESMELNQIDGVPNQDDTTEQKISSIIKEAIILFKQQREKTINAIKECHTNIQNSSPENRQQKQNDCRTNLNEIKEFYKEVRDQIRELIQENRDTVKTLIKETKQTIVGGSFADHDESDTEDTDESDTEDTDESDTEDIEK